jgi:hypothetical protein
VRDGNPRLVLAWTEYLPNGTLQPVSRADFRDWRHAVTGPGKPFESMALYGLRPGNLRASSEPARSVRVLLSSADLASTLGLRAEEPVKPIAADIPGPTAFLTYATWRALFGESADSAGPRGISVDGTRYEPAVSLVPEGRLPFAADVAVPLPEVPDERLNQLRGWRSFYSVGRLAPGTTRQEAEAMLRAEASRLGQEFPLTNRYFSVRLRPYGAAVATLAHGPLTAAGAGAALLLVVLVICWRQSVDESTRPWMEERELALILAVPLLIILWPVTSLLTDRLLRASVHGFMPMYRLAIHERLVLAYGAAATVGIALLALPIARARWLPGRARRTHARRLGGRWSELVDSLATVAAALATAALVVSAASAWGGLRNLAARDTGVAMRNLLLVSVAIPAEGYPSPTDRAAYLDRAAGRLAQGDTDGGIRGVGVAQATVGSGSLTNLTVEADGGPEQPPGMIESVEVNRIGRHYLEVADIPVLEGRAFTEADSADRVALISESAARRLFPQGAVGHFVQLGGNPAGMRIVGIVGDVRHASRRAAPEHVVYLPLRGLPGFAATILVRHEGSRAETERWVRRELSVLDRGVAVDQIRAGEDVLRSDLSEVRSPVFVLLGTALISVMLLVMRLADPRTSSRPGRSVWHRLLPVAVGVVPGAWLGHGLAVVVLAALDLPRPGTSLPAYLSVLGITLVATLVIWWTRPADPTVGGETDGRVTTRSWKSMHTA